MIVYSLLERSVIQLDLHCTYCPFCFGWVVMGDKNKGGQSQEGMSVKVEN